MNAGNVATGQHRIRVGEKVYEGDQHPTKVVFLGQPDPTDSARFQNLRPGTERDLRGYPNAWFLAVGRRFAEKVGLTSFLR